jgi:hypothetical protein
MTLSKRSRVRDLGSVATALALIAGAGLVTRNAQAQLGAPPTPVERPSLELAIVDAGIGAGIAIGGALGLEIFAPRLWFEIHAGEVPPAVPPPPPPPCCYAPPRVWAPPPPMVMAAPPPAEEPEPLHMGLAVSGLLQSAGPGQSTAGVAAALQVRTSPRSLFALEIQSLASDRQPTRSRRDDVAGLMAGRLFLWDAALAPYLELAGGLGHASIDTQAQAVSTSQLIGRAGVGIELRLGPHLVLDAQFAQVHRLRLDDAASTVAASDPAFIGRHEQSTELRGGLGYRF